MNVHPFWICPACKRKVRVRKDGRSSRHKEVNRFGQPSAGCVGALEQVKQPQKKRPKK